MIVIEHKPDTSRQDGGGSMLVIAHTAAEKKETIDHFRLFEGDPVQQAHVLMSPEPFRIERKSKGAPNGGWFRVVDSLPVAWSRPYLDELVYRTGFDGKQLPDMSGEFLTPRVRLGVLHHTYYLRSIWVQDGLIHFDALRDVHDWDGRKAADRARQLVPEGLAAELGKTPSVPEFEELPGGLFRRNTAWGRYRPPQPHLAAQWLFSALVDCWLERYANAAQRELVKASDGIMKKLLVHGVSDLHNIRRNDTGIRYAWDKPDVTWKAFREGLPPVTPAQEEGPPPTR